jgi:hypothetical protein
VKENNGKYHSQEIITTTLTGGYDAYRADASIISRSERFVCRHDFSHSCTLYFFPSGFEMGNACTREEAAALGPQYRDYYDNYIQMCQENKNLVFSSFCFDISLHALICTFLER